MADDFVLDKECYEALRRHLTLGNIPLCGWPEIEAFCASMRMQTRRGNPPRQWTLKLWGCPYTRQGMHAEAWTTTYLVIAWYVNLVRPKAGHRPKADPTELLRKSKAAAAARVQAALVPRDEVESGPTSEATASQG